MKKLYLTLCFAVISIAASGQANKYYSTDNGLSNSLINKIYQDSRGFIWIATEYGLNKFDGVRFTIYGHIPGDSTSLVNNYVRTVYEDGGGRLHIGTLTGLMRYEPGIDSFRVTKMLFEGREVKPHVTSVTELRSGELLVATSGRGVFQLNEDGNAYPAEGINVPSIYLNTVFEDSAGFIWIGSENDGLFRVDRRTGRMVIYNAPDKITSDKISDITEDRDGNIFVGTISGGVVRWQPESDRFVPVPTDGNGTPDIGSMFTDATGRVYVGTDGDGLKTYDPGRGILESVELASAYFDAAKGKIHSILRDRDQNLWLGYFQKGVLFVPSSENNFTYYGYRSPNHNIIGSGYVTSIMTDRRGTTWIGTDNDGIYGIDRENRPVAHYTQGSSPSSVPNTILTIFEGRDGRIWLGSYFKGLALMNPHTGHCTYIPLFSNEKVISVTEDRFGNLLIGTYGSGFFMYDPDTGGYEQFESMKQETGSLSTDELANDWVSSIICDCDGLIWLSHFKGVSCFDPVRSTFLTYLGRNNIIPETVGTYLMEDRLGRIWMGTTSGLYMFNKDTGEIVVYSEQDGLANNSVASICEDDKGLIWVSTYRGLSRLDPVSGTFMNFYVGDGLQGNEFSRGAVFREPGGRILMGGVNGVNAFYPDQIEGKQRNHNVYITGFSRYNQPVKAGDRSGRSVIVDGPVSDANEFTLSHNDNTFTIEFTTLDFVNPDRTVYQYMIDGLNPGWISTYPGTHRVTYNNLRPGKYRFRVRAAENGNYSPEKALWITIRPPWYGTWWALLIYTLLGILVIVGLINHLRSRARYRTELMHEEQSKLISEAKLQLFINVSHDIRTPMTLIISPLEKLMLSNTNREVQDIYFMIYRNAQRILRLINQMMDIRKLDQGRMEIHSRETAMVGFIRDLMLTFEYQAAKKNIDFRFDHTDESLKVWVDINNFDKVLLNILSNAFKFTPDGGEIRISLTTGRDDMIEGEYFEIAVEDTGSGFDEAETERIFERFYQSKNEQTASGYGTGIGLHLARMLVGLHHGVIFARQRTDGPGSRFVIRLPMGNAHFRPEELEESFQSPVSNILRASEMLAIPEPLRPGADAGKAPRAKTRYRVLIVEDEEEIREYIAAELSEYYKVATCRDGQEALEYILREKPDLVVSDIMMPRMDGTTLARKIKQNTNVNHIPVVLLTAKTTPMEKLEGLETGVDAYLEKPFHIDILRRTITNLIQTREQLRNKFSGNEEQGRLVENITMKSPDEQLMERIMRVVNEHLADPELSVNMLAEKVGLSRVHLHRKLKELTNQSARDFIRGVRLRQAEMLLSGKKLSISEVAYATGFTSLSHFSNSFKEFYGMPPKEYMAQNESKEDPR